MNSFLLDASALLKRYVPERGSALVSHLFTRAGPVRLACLMLGAAETVAALVRKRNGGIITAAVFAASVRELRQEVLDSAAFSKLSANNTLIDASLAFLPIYPINSSDGIVLQAALDLVNSSRTIGDDFVIVASDRRLLLAAQSGGLLTFDPENQAQAELDALIGP